MSINLAADTAKSEVTVEEKLKALYKLQSIDSQIDKIKIIRGELPLEVQDLEDELAGLETRVSNLNNELQELEHNIADKRNAIKESQSLIAKYEEQQNNVRNNREFDSLNKEIEYQTLDIQLSEKRIKEFTAQIESKKEQITYYQNILEDRNKDLEQKKSELDDIVSETEKDEKKLNAESAKAAEKIENRLIVAYKKIRENASNGLVVVPIERDACGGCFNKIPPQRQMDIRLRKKIIVCEYCGRILIDPELPTEEA
jgi:predicted  nucleic acid-binding Zn-ribbon protein